MDQDPKYMFHSGCVINRETQDAIPLDEPVFVLRAIDVHALKTLKIYHVLCNDADHQEHIEGRIQDFANFAQINPDRMKEPDSNYLL